MTTVADRGCEIAIAPLCQALSLARATFYRKFTPQAPRTQPRPSPPRALAHAERQEVLSTLNSEEFMEQAPAAVFATLLDRNAYLCSVRTMYRIMASANLVRERRDQLTHPPYAKPELMASAPNEVWSWDITKFKGPQKWNYFYLYVILDIFSRYVVGWMVAERESAALATRLIRTTLERHEVNPTILTIHADRGPSMRSKAVAHLLADLGVTKSHSRPYTSTDNPFSEAQFKTMKYCPEFPDRFGCLKDSEFFCRSFFDWYNHEHRHSGLGLMTPADVHFGRVEELAVRRQATLGTAFRAHPERFVRGLPKAPRPPGEVWINPPVLPRPEGRN